MESRQVYGVYTGESEKLHKVTIKNVSSLNKQSVYIIKY